MIVDGCSSNGVMQMVVVERLGGWKDVVVVSDVDCVMIVDGGGG